jgi:hypothetical protein
MKFYSYKKIREMLKLQDKSLATFPGLEVVQASMLAKCDAPADKKFLLVFDNMDEFDSRYDSNESAQKYVSSLKSSQDREYVEWLNDYITSNIDRLFDADIYNLYSGRWDKFTTEQKMQILNDEFDRKVGVSYHNKKLEEMYYNATELEEPEINNLWLITMPSGSVEYVVTSEELAKAIVEEMKKNRMDYGYCSVMENADNNSATK